MADQVYNLTQTGAEVQGIINDANNAKGAGATTSLTTDYIMLKDTNGQYHKIQKDSFTEAVRNTLASLLVNNDKGTTISQIAAIASGDFGSVTPANLASVLGAVDGLYIKNCESIKFNTLSNYSSISDLNDFVLDNDLSGFKIGFVNKNMSNLPSALSNLNRFWIVLIQSSSYDITQIVWGRGSNQPYFRCRQGNGENPPITWSSWKEL